MPCIIGIILATGILMMIRNCNIYLNAKPDILTIGLTCFLAAVYFVSRKIIKRGISPIMLICISAIVGVVAYGI
jgi:chromate transporter